MKNLEPRFGSIEAEMAPGGAMVLRPMGYRQLLKQRRSAEAASAKFQSLYIMHAMPFPGARQKLRLLSGFIRVSLSTEN
jgi:hypothetical protein